MDTLSNLVSSLAIIIILGSLLEMFLPSGELKKFVQVIIGLFIVVTILNPFLGLINKEWTTDLQAMTIQEQEVPLKEILANGEQLRAQNQNQAVQQYEHKLAAQVSGMANLIAGVQVKDVQVKVKGEEGVLGEIDKIELTVAEAKTSDAAAGKQPLVQPVVIDVISQSDQKRSEAAKKAISTQAVQKLKTTLANLYGISPDNIEIKNYLH